MNGILPENADQWFKLGDGFYRPLWKDFEAFQKTLPQRTRDAAHREFVLMWLDKIAETLEDQYYIDETENFFVLTHFENEDAARLRRVLEACLAEVDRLLEGIVSERHRLPVLHFKTADIAVAYASFFYHKDAFPRSKDGVVGRGHPHLYLGGAVLPPATSLLGDLAYGRLAYLPLPHWLRAGLPHALLLPHRPGRLELEMLHKLKAFWGPRNIQEFWSGSGFGKIAFANCSELAEVLVRLVMDTGAKAKEFFRQANAEDAGQQAAIATLGCGIDQILSKFLGPGDWTPSPGRWPHPAKDDNKTNEAARPANS